MAPASVKATAASGHQGFVVAFRMNAIVAVAAQGNKFKQEFMSPMLIAYARSDLLEKRRQLMERWCEYVAGQGEGKADD